MKKTKIDYILISCCTYKRPNMLKKSLESIRSILFPENIRLELLIIDDDTNASAQNVIVELQQNFPLKINYFIEEKTGIANARNRLLKEALNLGASHIALFDDDEMLDKKWLISHVNYYNQNQEAVIISGPTYNLFQKKYPKYIEKNNIFKQSTTKKTGLIRKFCASGNVFFPTSLMSEVKIYFDNSFVFMGGEDGDFFTRASNAGYTIVWNNDAINYEMVGDERANIKWILNRYYYNGYSGYLLKYKDNKKKLKKILSLIKITFVIVIGCLFALTSLIMGRTVFFNALGALYKTIGKLMAIIKNKPLNYYENVCGN